MSLFHPVPMDCSCLRMWDCRPIIMCDRVTVPRGCVFLVPLQSSTLCQPRTRGKKRSEHTHFDKTVSLSTGAYVILANVYANAPGPERQQRPTPTNALEPEHNRYCYSYVDDADCCDILLLLLPIVCGTRKPAGGAFALSRRSVSAEGASGRAPSCSFGGLLWDPRAQFLMC